MLQAFRKFDSSIGMALTEGARIMFMIFATVALIVCLIYQFQAITYRYSLDYGEAPLVDQAMRLANGLNIYRADLSTPPYTISNYPPLYVTVIALSVKIFGPAASFPVGRLISALSAWVVGICLFLIVDKATRDRLAGFVAGSAFIAFPFVTFWSPLLRIDMFALALSLAGLALLVEQPVSTRRFVAAALLLVAAIYTRQSYALAAPLGAFVWLLGQNWRRALSLAALVGGTTLILFLILNILTQGGFFYNIMTANVNEFGLDRLKDNAETFRNAALIPLMIGGFSLFLIRRWNPLWLLAAPYLIGATLSAATIGKIGSNVNYFLELCAALSLAAGVVIAWSHAHLKIYTLKAVLLIALAVGVGQMTHFMLNEKTSDLRDRRAFVNELSRLEIFVAETPGEILADEYMAMLTLQGRPLTIQPFEVTQLARAGNWDQMPLLDRIRKNEFSAIIIYEPWSGERWTPEMRTVINQSYFLADEIAGNKVYVPRTQTSVTLSTCPGAAWRLPSDSSLGVLWRHGGLNFYGHGNEGFIPVYAVADGLLTRWSGWFDAVAILHDDPLNPGQKVWIYYGDMGASDGITSFVAEDFPSGASSVPVKAGQVIGYQGTWNDRPGWATWVHVLLGVVRANGQDFPAGITPEIVLDPRPYFNLALPPEAESKTRQSIKCGQP